jgi:hypothetical protein
MEQEILEKAIKDVNKLAENYLAGGAKEGITKTALEAIQEIADIAERARKEQFIKK